MVDEKEGNEKEAKAEEKQVETKSEPKPLFQRTSFKVVLVVFAIVVILYLIIWFTSKDKYEDFAQCLSAEGWVLYGTTTCPHCNDQKEMFKGAVDDIIFIDCSLGDTCRNDGVEYYPTWGNKKGLEEPGVKSFKELSIKSGCKLPE